MSLVSEALRKARQEAAEREGRERGIPRGLVVPPKKWRSGPGLALAILIALAAAISGAGIAWWALSRPAQGPPVPAALAATAAGPSVAPAQAPRQPPEPPTSLASAAKGRERPPGAGATPQPQAADETAPVSPAPQSSPGSAPHSSETGAAQPGLQPERAEGGSGERSFVVDAELGHIKLHLDYVVYRPGSPFAGINGQQVIIGSVIEGFRVEEIGPETVRLRDNRGTVVLRTH